jgi:hypothetical protein
MISCVSERVATTCRKVVLAVACRVAPIIRAAGRTFQKLSLKFEF